VLKLSDLAKRPDFQAGPLSISPSRRRIEGPAGTIHLEPLIMQVFLLLLDARGELVTRDELFSQVWGGALVGDDSLNRAIARVRRIETETAPGVFEIETVPRTGYRLVGQVLGAMGKASASPGKRSVVSRRVLMGGAAAVTAILGAGGLWWAGTQEEREFNEMMARGEQALHSADPGANASQYLRRAVAIRPDNAKAQGLFAYARAVRSDYAETNLAGAMEESQRAARAALHIDPEEPNARVAQVLLERSMLDFAATEDRFRTILAATPDNILAMRQLWAFLQCVGRSREALAMVEQALALKPLAAGNHYPWAQLLWILGRNAEADRVIDRALQQWPSHRFVRFARFTIFAFTGRPRAALAMIESQETAPQVYTPEAVALWRISLAALDRRSPENIAAARKANVDAAKKNLRLTPQAMQVLSALGEIDAAFELANALFVVRGAKARPVDRDRASARSTAWRFAPWLFTPPTAPMRADPRFNAICDEIGLTAYWAKRGIRPDYQLGIT
jgi:DNA-binding winged helix-turn-helix (wHTH) protein/tetratricopeptide (TPR) repeat protein